MKKKELCSTQKLKDKTDTCQWFFGVLPFGSDRHVPIVPAIIRHIV